MASSEILLHPVRLRIVQTFLGDRALTTSQLAAELDDVPAGSLYRHVALLADAGILRVAAERRVRGSVERTYTVAHAAASIAPAELAAMTPEQHSQAFLAFSAGLIADFDRYLASGTPDLVRDGVGYNINAMWLTDTEFLEFARDLTMVFQPRLANGPGKGRKRRIAANVILPAPDKSKAT
ncbi:helix-turn-helix domain-containing protein [Lacisediminihabitans profunda]|uniref:Helix-turn-helix domain-containing protein n=1 Tax=Lacisediminihabitans profunda TaxID=2594790 RepID=A0A5C8USU6_9MICO|nr:helix-turn-helix domain-containing protein [Lacisediminihabitans profunda]TXN30590.1 helix-turn-helix domain-containing protein [Lacisediminihabitans profunda]